jgi:hypothetical protein
MHKDPRYWHSRGYLPHFDRDGFIQFITFRLADSVPQTVFNKWRIELHNGEITDALFRRRIEYYLDQNYGDGTLRKPTVANMVEEALLKWDGERFRLIAWVLMPNHVHLLMLPLTGHSRCRYNAFDQIVHVSRSKQASETNRPSLGKRVLRSLHS